jgi:uncharacterized protein (TIGR03032 family)
MNDKSASNSLALWLRQHNVSLALSTYRANRLIFLGRDDSEQLQVNECLFDRPMGLEAHGNSLWMVSRYQLWRFDNVLEAGQRHEGVDRLYMPAVSHTTGDVNGHEVVIQPDGSPLFVNTAFSCLAGVQSGSSFAPVWQPPFISKLAAEDRCHLNGLALVDGTPTWATACGPSDTPTGWRDHRSGGGVVLHIPSSTIAATGLSMPHSPLWHEGKLWLLNSGTGELGWIEGGRFVPLCFVPGFARGLAFVGATAVVGLSKLRSPQFTGLALEDRLQADGIAPGGCCGLRVIDLVSGAILHSLDLPEPLDELFDVAVLPGVRQARAFGLQDDDIHCLVKLPGQAQLVTVRPKAPSGNPYQGATPGLFGVFGSGVAAAPAIGIAPKAPPEPTPKAESGAVPKTAPAAVRYQQVFQLTPQTLAPYAALTFPTLAPGSRQLAAISGELLAVSAMAGGIMVGLVIAERNPGNPAQATVCSLMVAPESRRQGIATRLLFNLQRFLARQGVQALALRYHTGAATGSPVEPMLARLGWAAPRTDFVLIQSSAEHLAGADWNKRFPIAAPYALFPWVEATVADMATAKTLGAPPELLPPSTAAGLEPAVSLGLRHNGALVGWLIAHRMDADTVRYSSLYVAPRHRSHARGLALLAEGFTRQHQAGIPQAKAAVHVGNAVSWTTFERRVREYFPVVGQARFASVQLSGAAAQAAP